MSENNGATSEQLNDLSAPIPGALVKSTTQRGTTFSYVTARTVMNWLDKAVGRGNWKTDYRVIFPGDPKDKAARPLTVECTLSILIGGQWVGKADVGTEDNYSPEKAAYSNALKRAGAQWGIARELYGEGNVHEEDGNDAPAEQSARPAQQRASKPASKASADAEPDDVPLHGSQTLGAYDQPLASDDSVFEAKHVPAMKQAIVDCGLAKETNHAQNTIVAAMVAKHGVEGGLVDLFGKWTNDVVFAAVIEYRTAKEG